MDKFQKTLKALKFEFNKFKSIKRIIMYGSVARGDYSLRHSDLDLIVFLKTKKPKRKLIENVSSCFNRIGSKNGVKVHLEFQGEEIEEKDHTLLLKLIEEGKIIYETEKEDKWLGLKLYYVYIYNAGKSPQASSFSKYLNGKKSSYIKNGKKITRYYNGIVDGKNIIKLGNALLIKKNYDQWIKLLFKRFNINYEFKGRFYKE